MYPPHPPRKTSRPLLAEDEDWSEPDEDDDDYGDEDEDEEDDEPEEGTWQVGEPRPAARLTFRP